jgi:Mg-chelatase subunit ChlD
MGNTAAQHKPLDQWPELTPAQATEFDYILLVDQSGSMGEPSTRLQGKTKWQEVQEFVEQFARYAEQYDDDGITLIKFNSHAAVYDGVKAAQVHELFTKNSPGGSTNLAAALDEAWKKKAASQKKAIVVCVTDGAPNSTDDVEKALIHATQNIADETQLSYLFVQVGEDAGAAKFLDHLDNSLTGAKFDIVNTLSEDDAESMTIGQLLFQAINH